MTKQKAFKLRADVQKEIEHKVGLSMEQMAEMSATEIQKHIVHRRAKGIDTPPMARCRCGGSVSIDRSIFTPYIIECTKCRTRYLFSRKNVRNAVITQWNDDRKEEEAYNLKNNIHDPRKAMKRNV